MESSTRPCERCRAPLGEVRKGRLFPSARVEWIDHDGNALLRCAHCGGGRVWRPTAVVAQLDSDTGLIPPAASSSPVRRGWSLRG